MLKEATDMFRTLIRRDEGVGMITALIVSMVVFTLGATWFAVAVHDVEQTTFSGNRSQALLASEAGVRRALYELKESGAVWTGTGSTLGVCDLVDITSEVDGVARTVGQYAVEVTTLALSPDGGKRVSVEAWGWSPYKGARQADLNKIELEVDVLPNVLFEDVIHAGEGGIEIKGGKKGSTKGDVYSGGDMTIDKGWKILSDPISGEPGNLYVAGSLYVKNGQDLYVEGETIVNYKIVHDDNTQGVSYNGDVYTAYDTVADPDKPWNKLAGDHDAFFKDVEFGGSIFLAGTLDPSSNINGAPVFENLNSHVEPVPLPAEDPITFDPSVYEPAGWDLVFTKSEDFKDWWKDQVDNDIPIKGNIKVTDPENKKIELKMKEAIIGGDLLIYTTVNEIKLRDAATYDPAAAPITVSIVHEPDTTNPKYEEKKAKLKIEKKFSSSEDLNFLIFSKAKVEIKEKVTFYGSIYADSIKQNKDKEVSINYTPTKIAAGFSNSVEGWSSEPGIWREVIVAGAPSSCALP